MIHYLKAINYKGIKQVFLKDLGKINVLCGKNNSGKSSILEALIKESCFGIGKKLDSVDWLCNLFAPEADKYSNPYPHVSKNWFKEYINPLVDQNTIWYTDEVDRIKTDFLESYNKYRGLGGHGNSLFNFEKILKPFFEKHLSSYKAVLIPPKRSLEHQVQIETDEKMLAIGKGIVNHLFYLKNQDLKSNEYSIYKQIYNAFLEITHCYFNIIPEKNNKITLLFSSNGIDWLPADMWGLGLCDVIVILSIIIGTDYSFVFIEEPENHLHAEYQKRLLKYLKSEINKQFLITTHSSVFVDPFFTDKIFYVQYDNEVNLSDQTAKSIIIHSLGYSVTENLVSDALILAEGPTDIPVISYLLRLLGLDEKYIVRYWPLGGDIMASLDLAVFSERNNVFAIIDSDPGSSVQRTRFQTNCAKSNVQCFRLKRYALENYFPLSAIKEILTDQIPIDIKTLLPDLSVDDQIGFKLAGKSIKHKNHQIAQLIQLADIENTDLCAILTQIKRNIEKNDA
jgi:predicted ATP-dependent endonuclease of OLD family